MCYTGKEKYMYAEVREIKGDSADGTRLAVLQPIANQDLEVILPPRPDFLIPCQSGTEMLTLLQRTPISWRSDGEN